MAELTQTKPMIKPMERSIPPLMITKASPLANKSRELIPRIRLLTLVTLRKFSPKKLNNMSINTRKRNAQFLPKKPNVLLWPILFKLNKESLLDSAITIPF